MLYNDKRYTGLLNLAGITDDMISPVMRDGYFEICRNEVMNPAMSMDALHPWKLYNLHFGTSLTYVYLDKTIGVEFLTGEGWSRDWTSCGPFPLPRPG